MIATELGFEIIGGAENPLRVNSSIDAANRLASRATYFQTVRKTLGRVLKVELVPGDLTVVRITPELGGTVVLPRRTSKEQEIRRAYEEGSDPDKVKVIDEGVAFSTANNRKILSAYVAPHNDPLINRGVLSVDATDDNKTYMELGISPHETVDPVKALRALEQSFMRGQLFVDEMLAGISNPKFSKPFDKS